MERLQSRAHENEYLNNDYTFLSIDPAPLPYAGTTFESVQTPEGPNYSKPHSRQISESRHLLPSPQNLFEYKSTNHVVFGGEEARGSPFPGWSDEPQSLERTKGEAIRNVAIDIVIIALPLPFYALCGAMLRVNAMSPQEGQEEWFKQSMWVAATLFPLVFSLILGRLAIKLSSHRLEGGTSIDFLERLMGSRTFLSTLITQARLGMFAPIAICLIITWLFSPIGSQSALRALSVDVIDENKSTNATYFNTRQPASINYEQWSSSFMALFSASLLAPDSLRNNTVDIWGGVKIPLLSSVMNTTSPDSQKWYSIPQSFTDYTSIIGLPVTLPNGNITTFILESSYLELSCQTVTNNRTRANTTSVHPGLIHPYGPFYSSQVITNSTPWAIGYLGADASPLLSPTQSSTASIDAVADKIQTANDFPGILLYQDFTGTQNVTSIYCKPEQVYVESEVLCTDQCAVIRQRQSTSDHPPSSLTLLSFRSFFLTLSFLLPRSLSTESSRTGINMVQNYLYNPYNTTFVQTALPAPESRLSNVSLSEFAVRLGSIINTFTQGAQGSTAPLLSTTSATTHLVPKFTVHNPWLALLLLATTVMFLAALASAILRHYILARDYLSFVSSLARESAHVELPTGGATMDGLTRSQKLGSVKIRLGNVGNVREGWQIGVGAALSVGTLGIGSVDGTGKLDRRKLYV